MQDFPKAKPWGVADVNTGVLGVAGKFFTLNGAPFTVIESSDFSLFKRYLDGEDVSVIRKQRKDLGFNGERVWLLNTSVVAFRNGIQQDGIHPNQYPDFYERLRQFVSEGPAFVDLTVFTQTQTLMPARADQQAHLDATIRAVDGLGNVIISLVNEGDQHDNATAPNLSPTLAPSYGTHLTRGSNGADSPPPNHDAPWDAEEYHSNDLSEWQRKVGHNAMEWADQSGKPCWSSENTRPDNDGSNAHFEDGAEGAALLCAGSCYHSQAGKASILFAGRDLDAAQAWVRGAQKVPLEFQRGAYAHRPDLEGPNAIRVYTRTLPNEMGGRVYVVSIRP